MATDLTSVTYADGDLTYDSDMPMGALRLLFKAANSGDLTQMFDAYKDIVVTWPYEGDPKEMDGWDALRRSQFMRLNEALMESLGDLGEA